MRLPTLALLTASGLSLAGASNAQILLPDLVIHTSTPSTTVLIPGRTISMDLLVQNVGAAAAENFHLNIMLSRQAAPTSSDLQLGTVRVSKLSGLTGKRYRATVTIPSNSPAGTCYIGTYADLRNRVRELKENNNSKSTRVTCRGVIDLSVSSFKITGTKWQRGGLITIDSIFKNLGGRTSQGCRVGFYLSNNANITAADTRLGTYNLPGLAQSATRSHRIVVRVPGAPKLGNCYIGVLVDDLGNVQDYDTANNSRAVAGSCYSKGRVAAFGNGCAGRKGWGTPVLSASSADPYIGSTVDFEIKSGPRKGKVIYVVGQSRTLWNGFTLPLSMTTFGAPRCSLYASGDYLINSFTDLLGNAKFRVPIPVDNNLVGVTLYGQALGVDARANAFGASFSNALSVTIGSQR